MFKIHAGTSAELSVM